MRKLRVTWRLLRVGEHLLTGALLASGLSAMLRSGLQVRALPCIVQWWHRRLCRIIRLQVEADGAPAPGPSLLVANHISWLDIPALGALQPMTFLSKSEVRDWPLVGWLSSVAGTLFIERGGGHSSHVAGDIRSQLERGVSVLIFPEGTTTDGSEVRRFHPRLFAAAQDSQAPLQPVSLEYHHLAGRPAIAPFIGDDPFFGHMLRVLGEPGIRLKVSFHPPILVEGRDRRSLADEARERICRSLGLGHTL
jgi:lyso-ornithine lipid O-acyltransferase